MSNRNTRRLPVGLRKTFEQTLEPELTPAEKKELEMIRSGRPFKSTRIMGRLLCAIRDGEVETAEELAHELYSLIPH